MECLSDVTKVKEFKIRFLAFENAFKQNLSNQLNSQIDQTLFPYYENEVESIPKRKKEKMPLRRQDTKFSQRLKYQHHTLSEAFPECRDKSSLCVFPESRDKLWQKKAFRIGLHHKFNLVHQPVAIR